MGRPLKHGQATRSRKTSEYGTWQAMIRRCESPKATDYEHYGGRGIAVCERWRSFENFFADMGPKPSPKHSIDRDDNNADYEPRNCRWSTAKEQARNRRRRRDSLDLEGQRFGRWLALQSVQKDRRARFLCRCDCGTEKILRGDMLRSGNSNSCGCTRMPSISLLGI